MTTLQQQQRLIDSLCNTDCYDHTVEQVELVETHISWVLLAGDYAYKLKKGVDFGFLDYSTLEKRRQQCEEELRLNRRTAPLLYLEVVPIGGTAEAPQLYSEPAIEYVVKMRRFDQDALLSRQLQAGKLEADGLVLLAEAIAAFHEDSEVAAADSAFGTPEAVYHPVEENFEQIRARLDKPELLQRLKRLEQKARSLYQQLYTRFERRKAEGFIRDCHGDLHLNNIVLIDGAPLLFDCIEFNPGLRIIDVMSEIAFLVMDLEEHGRDDLAAILLNRYLERRGDYEGLRLMPFYLSYRAMVRAKVALLRLDQPGLSRDEREAVLAQFHAYLQLAEVYISRGREDAALLITHGTSGTGKTTCTRRLLSEPCVVRLRSDIERKRLYGIDELAASGDVIKVNIYSPEASARTYGRLCEQAAAALEGGYRVVVDATFLKREQRDLFARLAEAQQVPFTILDFQAREETMRQRIAQRQAQGSDASEADSRVLELQLAHYRPLDGDEEAVTRYIDSERDECMEGVVSQLQQA